MQRESDFMTQKLKLEKIFKNKVFKKIIDHKKYIEKFNSVENMQEKIISSDYQFDDKLKELFKNPKLIFFCDYAYEKHYFKTIFENELFKYYPKAFTSDSTINKKKLSANEDML